MIEWNEYWAHSPNDSGHAQMMDEHLREVADLAREFAAPFGAGEFAHWVGWLHDVGKFSDDFQNYLRLCHKDKLAGNKVMRSGGDHKNAGTRLASLLTGKPRTEAGVLVLGHHGGMQSVTDSVVEPKLNSDLDAVIARAHERLPFLKALPPQTTLPSAAGTSKTPNVLKREREMFLRMVFSCLVDADSLDTERHFQAGVHAKRQWNASLQQWKQLLNTKQTALQANAQSATRGTAPMVNLVRTEVYDCCVSAGAEPQGAFSLTVPTGGGKTLASFAFALAHATHSEHPLDRIIYAIPYTSIIDQTAEVFQDLLGPDAPILVHHSALPESPKEDGKGETSWRRLVSQNWDAPLTVTTTVQLFESLFSNAPGRCRKLHNLANSVIILDEAQMLPISLLKPILDGLKILIKHYHATVVFCTATQPAFESLPKSDGFKEIRPIVPAEMQERHFEVMKRVSYRVEWEPWEWSQVAAAMRKDDLSQCLAIVNTRANAIALLDALDDPDAFHLSTLLCGAHRMDVLKQVRTRLAGGDACRLVSTQVIECGVDVDFPRVLRAIGPLDRIVQAAGRCNREGLEDSGEVIVFQPAQGGMPRGEYQTMVGETLLLLQEPNMDFHDPKTYTRYFRALYGERGGIETDKPGIQKLRQEMDFPEVAKQFRMIEQDTRPILVGYSPKLELFERIRDAAWRGRMTRDLWRQAQPLLVNLYTRDIEAQRKAGRLQDAIPGSPDTLYLWIGEYDATTHRGLVGLFDDPADPIYSGEKLVV